MKGPPLRRISAVILGTAALLMLTTTTAAAAPAPVDALAAVAAVGGILGSIL